MASNIEIMPDYVSGMPKPIIKRLLPVVDDNGVATGGIFPVSEESYNKMLTKLRASHYETIGANVSIVTVVGE